MIPRSPDCRFYNNKVDEQAMGDHRSTYLKSTLFAGVLILLNATNIQAATPACGTTLTANTTLSSDMLCPSTAIRFNAGSNDVVLDDVTSGAAC